MLLNFDDAIRVGEPSDLIEIQRSTRGAPTVASSKSPRGLSMKSLYVTQNRRGPWSLLGRRKQIYFLSVAFDLSDRGPVVFPPAQVPADAIYRVHPGQAIQFTLGDGAPIFPPRTISGGLVMYITVCDADKGTRHVGEVLAQVHQDLNKDGSLTKVITGFIKSPSKVVIDEVLTAATAALQPIATILKAQRDEYIGLFTGIFPSKGPWQGKLTGSSNGTTIELAELR